MSCSTDRLRRDRPLAAGIFFLVLAVYILTYNGAFKSNDERALFSGTDSFVKRGVFTVDQIYWDYTHVGMLTKSGEMVPNYEPAPMVLAIPLYLWGQALGAAVQGTMFLGLVVTAALAAVVYLCLIELGYGRRTATLAALILALATHIWPYSRTLYREPLTALAYTVAFYGLLRYRAAGPRRLGWLVLAGSALGLALLNKQTSVAVAPALVVLAVAGEWRRPGGWRGRVAPALAGLLPVAFFMLLYWIYKDVTLRGVTTFARDIVVYTTNPQLSSSEGQRLLRAFLGLTISPYKGMLWYSPALLLGLAGTWPFLRRHLWEGAACWTAIVVHLAGYSRYLYWSGGVTWGSRYMLVLIPFGIMLAAPVLAWLLNEAAPPVIWHWRRDLPGRTGGRQGLGRPERINAQNAGAEEGRRAPGQGTRWQKQPWQGLAAAACLLLIVLSFGLAILGVSLDWRTYEVSGFLLPQAKIWGGIGETIDTLYLRPAYSPVLGNLKLLLGGKQPLDFAWVQQRPQLGWALLPGALALSLAAIVAAAVALAWLWRHPESRRGARTLVAGEALATVVCCSALLLMYRQGDAHFDPYGGDRFLRPMDAALKSALAQGQASCCRTGVVGAPSCTGVLVVPDDTLTDYFLNYLTAPLPWYDIQAQPVDTKILDQLMVRYPNIWIARDRNAADDDKNGRRGTERYLADHAYKVDEQTFGDWARLIHFSAAGSVTQTITLKQTLGEMALDQVALRVASGGPAPACSRGQGGQANGGTGAGSSGTGAVQAQKDDTLQIGLNWRALAKPAANYTVFVQLLDAGGQVKAQRDRWPGDGLYPTAGLAAGEALVDNLALRLDLPPGRYRLIAGMYRNDVTGLPRLTGPGGDHLSLAEVEIH